MKSIFLASIFFLCLFSGLLGQSIVSCTPNSAVTGQGLTVSIIGSNTNFQNATSTYLYHAGQTIHPTTWTHGSPTSIVATYSIPPNVPTGNYDVVVRDSDSISLAGGFTIGTGVPAGNYGRVHGRLYQDDNSNCLWDTGEQPYINQMVEFLPGPFYTTTNALGDYDMWLPLGTYDINFVPHFPSSSTCPATGTRNITLNAPGQFLTNEDFATDSANYSDATVLMYAQALRPGMQSAVTLIATNLGNVTIPAGTLTLVKPSITSLYAATPMPSMIQGDTLTWNFSNLVVSQNFVVWLQTAPGTALNTPYVLENWITPNPMDFITNNNSDIREGFVVGSYDPNDKQVHTQRGSNADGDILPSDSVLTYQVRFQNTGTDTAFNIYVRDTLDATHLDLSTFRLLYASHDYRLACSSGGQIEVAFPNILLPDSGANQLGSNGTFLYEVKRRNNLALGTVIPNSAAIYFDFNVPVITNTTETRICELFAANFTSAVNGFSVQCNDLSVGTIISHSWDFGDGTTSALTSPSHTYTSGGTYIVCETVTNVCGTDTHCDTLTIAPVGMPNPYSGFQITLVPNPMQDQATLWVADASKSGTYELTLYDISGQLVRTLPGQLNQALNLERKGLASGMYIYRIQRQGMTLGLGRMVME